MRHLLWVLCLGAPLPAACTPSASVADSGTETDADTDTDTDTDTDADADADTDADADADADADTDTDTTPPYCTPGCLTAADCSLGSAAYDTDNYRCLAGACEYTGCVSTAECATTLGSEYVCASIAGAPYDYCMPSCTTPADCDTGAGLVYDASHYECESQVCRWQGCANTAECVSTLGSDWVCYDNGVLPACLEACATSADCGNGYDAYDADNYVCDRGACVYTGCRGDAECEDLYGTDAACFE